VLKSGPHTDPNRPAGNASAYVYGPSGELLGEYALPSGAPIREYVWLGSTPVAVVTQAPGASSAEIFEIHADHLNAPRLALDTQGRQRWTWLAEPFGNEAANPAPTANLGAVNIPLRHPGQYWDAESGLFYNHHRFYDPKIGRYLQSDPIGLEAGVNTYTYVEGNPVSYTDPKGLETYICKRPLGGKPGSFAPPVVNHTYVCVGSGANMTCGSTTAASGQLDGKILTGAPGGPTTPAQDYYKPEACERRQGEDSCIETCIANELKKPTRPKYAIGPMGTDCQEYSENVVSACEKRCVKR
jgi:RHS repeat-associated protein